MKILNQNLEIVDVPTEDLPGYPFPDKDLEFLAVAEGLANLEWMRVCGVVGLKPHVQEIPPNYSQILKDQGRWNLDYAAPGDF